MLFVNKIMQEINARDVIMAVPGAEMVAVGVGKQKKKKAATSPAV